MRRQPNSRMCFLCGRENPVGLNLAFYEDTEAEQVRVEFVVPDHFQGYPGVVHGGIVAAILDELSGRAVMLYRPDDDLMATVRLEVRYCRPTPTGTRLLGVGWVERLSGVGARVAGKIMLPDGTVTAECQAVLAQVPESFRVNWEEEKQHWRVDE